MEEITLSIVKPDGVRRNKIGGIVNKLESGGLKLSAMKMIRLSKEQAEAFYAVHRERPFYDSLVKYMCSDKVVVMALKGDNAVARCREIMGATDPANAASGTIRQEFGVSIEENSVHGSDSVENAAVEVSFFFASSELG